MKDYFIILRKNNIILSEYLIYPIILVIFNNIFDIKLSYEIHFYEKIFSIFNNDLENKFKIYASDLFHFKKLSKFNILKFG